MSFNRENVTWQSKDGTWNLGFFKVIEPWSYDDNYDPEWDVEYDFSVFEWVSTGHHTMDAATQSWPGANPGGSSLYHYYPVPADDEWGPGPGHPDSCERYDKMAATYKEKNPPRPMPRRLMSYPL